MITIMPADKAFLERISAPAGADAMVLRDSDGTVFGHALFTVAGDVAEILAVQTDEPLMTEGLIRAVINTGDCRGAASVICRVESLIPVLKRLEFVPLDGVYTVSVQHFLYGECKCK